MYLVLSLKNARSLLLEALKRGFKWQMESGATHASLPGEEMMQHLNFSPF
jgi:hypothetical protein